MQRKRHVSKGEISTIIDATVKKHIEALRDFFDHLPVFWQPEMRFFKVAEVS